MACKDRPAPSPDRFWRFRSTAAVATAASFYCAAAPGLAHNEAGGGEQIFMQNNCFVCHGQQGFGGVGPALRNDPFLKLGDHVVGHILMGRGVMPPFGDKLDDRQVAAVATYIRNSWGNHFGDVSPEQVAQIRHDLDAVRQQTTSSPPETTGSARPQPGKR